MSSISAGTTTTTGYVVTSDTTGALVLKTGASGTTAVTIGADQSVTFAGSQTFSGGTANGVLYLNGSKVVTSGSALTFDGTTLGNSTSGTPLSLNRTGAGTALIELKQSGTVGSYLGTSGASDMIFFNGSAAELMRLNGTGLGIGTSSPSQKLHVVGNALVTPSGGWTTGGVATQYFGDIYGSIKYDYNTTNFLISSYGTFSIATNGTSPTTRLTVDSSGNLGLGVTPSAWASVKAIQYINGAAWGIGTTDSGLSHNAYFSGGWKYISSSAASTLYAMSSGAHAWSVAPSGTAGNAITFTQAMTLGADGNLGVGTTGATYRIEGWTASSGTLQNGLNITNGANADFTVRIKTNETWVGPTTNTPLIFANNNNTERARIDSSGNLLVGTTTAYSTLTVQGGIRGFSNGTVGGVVVADAGGTAQNFARMTSNGSDIAWGQNIITYPGTWTKAVTGAVSGGWVINTNSSCSYYQSQAGNASPLQLERLRIDSAGSFAIIQPPGQYTIDTAGGATSIANGGTVNFANASGMLLVNNWTNGGITIFLCGGGSTSIVSSVSGTVGTFTYNAGINGYTWTNNYGATAVFGFQFFRTRANA